MVTKCSQSVRGVFLHFFPSTAHTQPGPLRIRPQLSLNRFQHSIKAHPLDSDVIVKIFQVGGAGLWRPSTPYRHRRWRSAVHWHPGGNRDGHAARQPPHRLRSRSTQVIKAQVLSPLRRNRPVRTDRILIRKENGDLDMSVAVREIQYARGFVAHRCRLWSVTLTRNVALRDGPTFSPNRIHSQSNYEFPGS